MTSPPPRMVIRYCLTEAGQEVDARYIYERGHQMSRHRQLSKGDVAKIRLLLRRLPDSEKEDVARDRLVTVTFHDRNKGQVREYHRQMLPLIMKEILGLLGGIRYELTDTIRFSSAVN